MFDAALRKIIDPPINRIGVNLAHWGVRANTITVLGAVPAILACAAVALGYFTIAIVFIIINRLMDGLDGAVARATKTTDFGGYLDIVIDFMFYASIPFAFILYDPVQYGVISGLLLFCFMGTGSSFLAFAIIAAKHKQETTERGTKSFYYLGGLAEGSETIAFLILVCSFPEHYTQLGLIFAAMCLLTTFGRIYYCWKKFGAL